MARPAPNAVLNPPLGDSAVTDPVPEGATVARNITLPQSLIEEWAGQPLTDEQIERLERAIPHSSIPESVNVIVSSFTER